MPVTAEYGGGRATFRQPKTRGEFGRLGREALGEKFGRLGREALGEKFGLLSL